METIHSKLNESVWDDLSVREMEKYSFADFDVMYEKYLGKEIMSEI